MYFEANQDNAAFCPNCINKTGTADVVNNAPSQPTESSVFPMKTDVAAAEKLKKNPKTWIVALMAKNILDKGYSLF